MNNNQNTKMKNIDPDEMRRNKLCVKERVLLLGDMEYQQQNNIKDGA